MLLGSIHNNGQADPAFRAACLTVTEQCYGRRGVSIYRAFDWINEMLFFGELPMPLIVIGLTAHGRCLGWSWSPQEAEHAPVIMLHPSIWGGTERPDPWGISPDVLGRRYALDVAIHESFGDLPAGRPQRW